MFSRNPRGRSSSPRGVTANRAGRPNMRGRRKRPAERELDFTQFVKKAIQTTETEAWNPTHRFADFEMHSKLKANVATAGYVHPTPIQDGAIPHILAGRDESVLPIQEPEKQLLFCCH